jgi:serine/threonine-protein kinase
VGEERAWTPPPRSAVVVESIDGTDAVVGANTVIEPALAGDSLIIDIAPLGAEWAPEASGEQRLVDRGEIARGGMARIHRVFDRHVLRQVALKRVEPEHVRNAHDAAQLLLEEAQITGQLDHPHIVPVYDLIAAADGAPMFTMKLVRGQTLAELIKASAGPGHTPTELRRILDVFLKVCDAVAFAHSRGVIHRDLKPENVMIGSHNQVYVMDWGCALLVQRAGADGIGGGEPRVTLPPGTSRRGAPDTVLGTAAYMAPEQASGRVAEIDQRTDVYALGGILYQVMTRRPPHYGRTVLEAIHQAQRGEVTPPELLCPEHELPRGLAPIAMKALAREPKERYASVQELRDAVEGFVSGAGRFMSRRFAVGEVLVREGEPGDRAYVLTSGTCEVSRLEGNATVHVGRLAPGDVFGETAVIVDERWPATVTALDDVVVTVVTRDALESDLGLDSWVGAFVRALAQRARENDRRLHAQERAAAFGRVVEAVRVYLAAAGHDLGGGWLEAPWSRISRAVAETLGLDVEEVNQAVLGSAELHLDAGHDVLRGRSLH